MIKESALRYKSISILCKTYYDFLKVIDIATEEMIFSKTLKTDNFRFFENKEYILENYQSFLNKKETIALILVEENVNYTEFQFYCRNYSEYDSYNDWDRFKMIDCSIYLRKEKLKQLKQCWHN